MNRLREFTAPQASKHPLRPPVIFEHRLNLPAMTLGRAKDRTATLDDEIAKQAATKAANLAKAASKRRETWANKRAKSGA